MKIIERSPIPLPTGGLSIVDRLRGTFSYGLGWLRQLQAEQTIIDTLARSLDDGYSLFHNLPLPVRDYPVPLLLIGPPGLCVLNVITQNGAYRAKGDEWLLLGSGDHYTPAQPNQMLRASVMAREVCDLLMERGQKAPTPAPVVLCVSAHISVETARPVVRVVQMDAIDKFCAGLAHGQPAVAPEKVAAFTAALENPPAPQPVDGLRAGPAEAEKVPTPSRPSSLSRSGKPRKPADAPRFSRKQWTVLGIMATVLVVLLVAFIFLAMLALG